MKVQTPSIILYSLLFLGLFLHTSGSAYSASGSENTKIYTTGSTSIVPTEQSGSGEERQVNESSGLTVNESGSLIRPSKTNEEEEEEEKLKNDITTYIIESYKAQGTRVIKDLSVKLTKTLPDKTERQEAYIKIRTSLELRSERTEKLKISETKKLILREFLGHMIELLDKKIDELN